MAELKLGTVEARFADIVWESEPISTSELVRKCAETLNWKRTTTYTVLKRLCERGIFITDSGTVTALISRADFYSAQSEKFVEETFAGSLPAFIAAFTAHKSLSKEEVESIIKMIDNYEEE